MRRGVRAVAAGGAARRAARALVQAARRRRAAAATGASCGSPRSALGVSATATWFLQTVSTRVQRRFRDKVTIALESHVATAAGVGRDDRASRAARISRSPLGAAQPGVRARPHVHVAVLDLRLDPAPRRHDRAAGVDSSRRWCCSRVFALPTVLTSTWRPAVERAREERGAPANRLARHCSTSRRPPRPARRCASPGIGDGWYASAARRGSAGTRPVAAARWASAALAHAARGRSSAPATSAPSCSCRRGSRAPAGDVLLVLAAGSRLSAYIGATVGEIGFLRGIWMDGSRRLAWLEDYAASLVAARRSRRAGAADAKASASITCRSPIPGTDAAGARRCDRSTLPAGTVVAIVGENGAGKTTLVKLLAKMYEPTRGRILVDDTTLARMAAGDWRARLAGAFQDFFRFEFRARHTVGVGDVPRLDDEPAVVSRGRAAPAPTTSSRGCRGSRDAARPDLAGRRRRELRPVAEARARARLHARPAAAAGARRADRRARRRDRARAVRALRRRACASDERQRRASPSSCRTASRPCGWPI